MKRKMLTLFKLNSEQIKWFTVKKVKKCLDISKKELRETVRGLPLLYDKSNKGFKQQDVVKNTCNGVARALDFVRNGN